MNRECIITDTAAVQTREFDCLNIDSICSSVCHLHCVSISSDHILSIHNSPSTKSYNASFMGMIDIHNIESPHSFLVFDSGATLTISPSEEDFVGPIDPFQTYCRLGGMSGGMHIAGIDPIK